MSYEAIAEKIKDMPVEYLDEIEEYIEFLAFKISRTNAERPKRRAGVLKGKITLSDDFDAPLEDFREYM